MGTVNDAISYWFTEDGLPAPREPLPGDTSADVVIVGGGYTGLWTAYFLKRADPELRITVLEQRFCGYGASGRDGGWLYNGIAGRNRYARLHGHESAVRLQKAMNDTVAEVIRVAGEEKWSADLHQGGVLEVALTPAQLVRLRAFHEAERAYGEDGRLLLGARETAERIRIAGAVGSSRTPHGARLHPVTTGSASGSRSRCAGSGCMGCTRRIGRRTGGSLSVGAPRRRAWRGSRTGWRGAADSPPGRLRSRPRGFLCGAHLFPHRSLVGVAVPRAPEVAPPAVPVRLRMARGCSHSSPRPWMLPRSVARRVRVRPRVLRSSPRPFGGSP